MAEPVPWTNPLAANMGAATKEEIEAFGTQVLSDMGFEGEFRWTTAGSICIRPNILVDESTIGKYRWHAKDIVLHEVAHLTVMGHGQHFYEVYATLLVQYASTDIKIGCNCLRRDWPCNYCIEVRNDGIFDRCSPWCVCQIGDRIIDAYERQIVKTKE